MLDGQFTYLLPNTLLPSDKHVICWFSTGKQMFVFDHIYEKEWAIINCDQLKTTI